MTLNSDILMTITDYIGPSGAHPNSLVSSFLQGTFVVVARNVFSFRLTLERCNMTLIFCFLTDLVKRSYLTYPCTSQHHLPLQIMNGG